MPLHYYRFSVNGYVSLTGFHEFTPIPTCLIIQSTLEITALKTTYRSMITASTDIYRFIIQLSTLMGAEKSSETNSRMRRVTGDDDNIMTTDRDYSIRPMRETEYDRDIESNIIPTSQMSAISSRRSYNGRDASPSMKTNITTRGRDYSIRPMRETEYDRDIESNTIPTSQLRPIISQRSCNGRNASPAMMTILS